MAAAAIIRMDSRTDEMLQQIAAIQSTCRFRALKTILFGNALFLAFTYLFSIHFFEIASQISANKKYLTAMVLLLILAVVQIVALFAIVLENLILILIYDIITKITLITFNPTVCIQCFLLNCFIKDLDKIHKLKQKI